MPWYYNHNAWTVKLTGPDGSQIRLKSGQDAELSDYFDQYRLRGFISFKTANTKPRIPSKQTIVKKIEKPPEQKRVRTLKPTIVKPHSITRIAKLRTKPVKEPPKTRHSSSAVERNKIVGRQINIDAQEIFRNNLQKAGYPVSNGIGIGILSYNRLRSLRRLMDSIIKYTDLTKTTVFISDDASTDKELLTYLSGLTNVVVINNSVRGGIAVNSNRLLRCLDRFKYGFLLNDDMEVLKHGWEDYYVQAMEKSKLAHLVYRESGVYKADLGNEVTINELAFYKVTERPHGAFLAFTHEFLEKAGYFNTSYGTYGMEHVDWSLRAAEVKLQPDGFYDVAGSTSYVKLHDDDSSIDDKNKHLTAAKEVFKRRPMGYIPPDAESKVPAVSYVVPYKDVERNAAVGVILNNIRAQRYPQIDIHLVEHDPHPHVNANDYYPINLHQIKNASPLFNKSMAFNLGVSKVKTNRVILHDADTMAPGDYTSTVCDLLDSYDACHIGKSVIYATRAATDVITASGAVAPGVEFERVVGYYEGGSLACDVDTYWRVGGFNQDFESYGCEDCDFYARLSNATAWYGERTVDLLHLWHSRIPGWEVHHAKNKALEQALSPKTIADRIHMQRDQLRKLGYSAFLK